MPTVQLEVPAAPAVHLQADAVAVVAHDRACQPAADALTRGLADSGVLHVDHRAEVRLELIACGDDESFTVEQQGSQDSPTRRRTDVAARAHAVVAVTAHGQTAAHLIGAGRHHLTTSWTEPNRMARVRNTAQRQAFADLADDLVQQLSPVPMLVERRVYPNASNGSARELHTLAVRAEQGGDVELAWLLAQAAHLENPTPRTASYLDALHRRRQLPVSSD